LREFIKTRAITIRDLLELAEGHVMADAAID
jgi:hypothetical protein